MSTVTIRRIEDIEDARRLHDLAFPVDDWAGDDHTYWAARDESGKVIGFASALHNEEKGWVYFSRVAVTKAAQGQHLSRRLIRHALMWAQMRGATRVLTYTTLQNYPSLTNLLACGFRFYKPEESWVGKRVHYLRHTLE